MAASDELKEAIVNYFDCTGVKGSKKSDWKRTDKRTLADGQELREFHNAKLGRTVYTLGEDEDAEILEKDQWVYGFNDTEDLGIADAFCLSFEPLDRFLRNGHIYDQHQQNGLVTLFGLPGNFDEASENQFLAYKSDYNDLTIHIMLKKAGFKFSKELSEFLMAHKGPTTVSTGPDLSIVPAILDPNYSAPLMPASKSAASSLTPRQVLDNAIMAAFQGPLMANEGYATWNELMRDYQYSNAGEALAGAMIAQVGPMPTAFNARVHPHPHHPNTFESLHDNLHGLENVTYGETNGEGFYVMEVDRSGWSPTIEVFINASGDFDIRLQTAPSKSTSTITRFTNKNPGQVFAARQAQHQQQQAGMMAAIGQMAAQLGATGGVTIGSTHIPAAPLAPGMRPLVGTPPLPPSGIFNSPGMQNAMPGMASPYPELAHLQPAVQAAFIAARVMGNHGLEQENTNWADGPTLAAAINQGNFVSVERSNLIWTLFEEADDGSGTPLEDYFTLDNELLHETFCEVFDVDEPDDLEVIDDTQVYSPPYDLPVPQPAPFNPIAGLAAGLGGLVPPAGGHGGRPAPMVGPASMNARAGSFAPPPAPPAAVTPPPPPPGNAKAHVNADSGDKWAEFCGEVWGFYEANKANLPLDLDWYDRYRPREAQITGLGYEFIRREFTGVMVKMGYLDRDGVLIENIDIPAAVLEELLKEWGGDWNVDDITQMINKRKGENPETGFSYTSEQLWDEVKALLDSEGWKESK